MDLSSPPDLALAHLSVLDVPPLEMVNLAAKSGFSAIGLRLVPAFPGSPFYQLSAGTALLKQMCQRLRDEAIYVNDIEFIGIGESFAAQKLLGLLEVAGQLGARRLSVCGDDPERSRLKDNFASLCDLAADFQLSVDLEYMAWREVKNFEDALDVVSAVQKPNARILIDVLHLIRTGGTFLNIGRVPSGTIGCVQLCDTIIEKVPNTPEELLQEARSGRLVPGQGTLPLEPILNALPEGTVLSLEVPASHSLSPEQHARNIYLSTQQVIASFTHR